MEQVLERGLLVAAKLWLRLLSPSMVRLWAPLLGVVVFLGAWWGWRMVGRTALGRAVRWWVVATLGTGLLAGVLYGLVAMPEDPELAAVAREAGSERFGGMPYPAPLAAAGSLAVAVTALAAGWRWYLTRRLPGERRALEASWHRLRRRGRAWAALAVGLALLTAAGAGVAGAAGGAQIPALRGPSLGDQLATAGATTPSPATSRGGGAAGTLWVGTPAGISRLEMGPHGPRWHVLARPRVALPANQVTVITPAPDGTVWVATHGGLARYAPGLATPWQTATVENAGLPYPTVLGLAVDQQGVAWAATGFGAAMVDPRGQSRVFTQRNAPLLHQLLDAVHVDAAGLVWFGGAGGVNVYRPARPGREADWLAGFGRLSSAGALPDNQVYTILSDSRGRVWFGTAGGAAALTPSREAYALGTLERSRWLTLTRPDAPLAHDAVHAIVEDAQGRIWFGTKGGITVLDEGAPTPEGRWQQVGAGPGALPHPWVQALAVSPDGRIWAGTRGGLAVYDPSHPDNGWLTYRAHPVRRWTGYLIPGHWEQNLIADEVTALAWVP
ncbi:MAG TPA: two-component regulator propeller domain-containing protein [Chloroflexota bacterium]|nr:two-component regulator propeller domain-containing protein [Chloroflexota bacterium]